MVKVYDAPDYLGEKEEVKETKQPKQPKQPKEKTDGKK